MGPRARTGRVCWWGAQLAETLVKFGSATAIGPRTASKLGSPFGGVWVWWCGSGWWCGWFGVPDILLGPEGTSCHGCGVWFFWSSLAFVAKLPHILLFVPWFRGVGGSCGVCGGWLRFGVGRCLRIAQWTRASLWSSCRGQTVNALAPGADEGRGRPR
jgi:hypothetical protein